RPRVRRGDRRPPGGAVRAARERPPEGRQGGPRLGRRGRCRPGPGDEQHVPGRVAAGLGPAGVGPRGGPVRVVRPRRRPRETQPGSGGVRRPAGGRLGRGARILLSYFPPPGASFFGGANTLSFSSGSWKASATRVM